MPENWEAVTVFLESSTQWRRAGLTGRPVGLDYSGVRAGLALARRRPGPTLFPKLQVLEAAAVEAFDECAAEG